MRPCMLCAVIMYAILVTVIFYEDDNGRGGLFDALRLSPADMELNLLLRVKYDPFLGLAPRSRVSVFEPVDCFGNFFKAFIRYLLEPSYGKIERI